MYRLNKTLRHPLSRVLLALFLVFGGLSGCKNDSTTTADATDAEPEFPPVIPSIEDSTMALVIDYDNGTDELTTEVFQAQLVNYETQFRAQQPGVAFDEALRERAQQSIANAFIERRLLIKEAAKLGLAADPAEVESRIDLIVAQNQLGSREALEQAIAVQGITLDSLRSFLGEELLLQKVGEQIVEATAMPTAEEIQTFSQEQGEEVWAQHILFQPDANNDAVLEKANAVLDSAKTGADFSALARRHSQGPSASNGGDLGFFKKDEMIGPFSEAAFALADSGDVAPDLVETTFGYHIIRLLGRRDAAPIDTARARIMLTQNRQRDAYQEKYRQLREAVTVRVNPQIITADLDS